MFLLLKNLARKGLRYQQGDSAQKGLKSARNSSQHQQQNKVELFYVSHVILCIKQKAQRYIESHKLQIADPMIYSR